MHKLWIEKRYVGEFADFDDAMFIATAMSGGDLEYVVESLDENGKVVESHSNRVPDYLIAK